MKQETSLKWTLWQTFAFRAFSLYLILYFLFISDEAVDYVDIVPGLKYVCKAFNICAVGLTSLVNKLFIHRHYRGEMYSDDEYWTFVCFMSLLVLAVIASLIWTWIDKGKKFTTFGKYTNLFARYYLAFVLAIYASLKFIGMQFDSWPWPVGMMKPVGQLDPHQMFWSFMGSSQSYGFFSGVLEFTACLLLLFRRTSAAGALLAVPVLINIIVLDIAYDTWLKFPATHLLLFAIYILLPDIKSLFQYLFLRHSKLLSPVPAPLISNKKYSLPLCLLKFAIIGAVFFVIAKRDFATRRQLNSPYANVMGIHQIIDMTGGGQPKAITRSDSTVWEKLAVNMNGSTTVLAINGKLIYCQLKKGDPVKRLLEFAPWADSTYMVKLHYDSLGKGDWLFTGTIKNDSVRFTTHRTEMSQTTLLKDNGKIKWFYWDYK